MQVDFKKEGAGGKNARNSQDIRESELLCVTDFDFIYDCPMSKLLAPFRFIDTFRGNDVFHIFDLPNAIDSPKDIIFSKW